MFNVVQLVTVVSFSVTPPPEWAVVDEIVSSIRDFSVVFETDTKVDPTANTKFINESTSGTFKFHRDGIHYIEWIKSTPDGVVKRRASVRAGGEPAKRQTVLENPKSAPQDQYLDVEYSGCQGANFPIWLFPWSILIYGEKTWPEEITFIGQQKIESLDCQVFQRSFCGYRTKIFICPEKSGQIIRLELYEGTELFIVLRDVELREFTDPNGKKVWFPVQGFHDNYWLGDRGLTTKPVLTTQFRFLPGTLKLNTGAPSKDFEVQFDPRVKVHGVRPPKKVNTRDPVTRANVTDEVVDETVKRANLSDAEAKDKAPQAVDIGIGTLWTALICLAVGCAVGAVFVYRRK